MGGLAIAEDIDSLIEGIKKNGEKPNAKHPS
jgi:hypothetical protein